MFGDVRQKLREDRELLHTSLGSTSATARVYSRMLDALDDSVGDFVNRRAWHKDRHRPLG